MSGDDRTFSNLQRVRKQYKECHACVSCLSSMKTKNRYYLKQNKETLKVTLISPIGHPVELPDEMELNKRLEQNQKWRKCDK